MRRTILAVVTTAVVSCGLLTGTASAQSLGGILGGLLPTVPTLPTTPSVPSVPGVVGTGTDCAAGGLVTVNLGGTSVCVAPAVGTVAGTQSCANGGIAVAIAGQGIVCLAPGQGLGTVPGSGGTACPDSLVAVNLPGGGGLACVVPTTIENPISSGTCRDGLIPVQVLGGALGCVVAGVIGDAGASGANGAAGAGGANGANGAGGSGSAGSGTSGSGANGANGTNGGTTGAAGSGSAAATRRIYKPILTLSRTLRGSRKGTVRSSSKRVVITVIGRRHGRVVRYTKQATLRLTGKATAARPYSAKVKITVKTKGRISIRLTSRGGSQVRTAVYQRTVRGH